MDGDHLSGEPSDTEGNGSDGGATVATPKSLGEIFTELCPQYMAMGMSYREFWHSNTKAHRAYRLAWEQRKRYRNWEMWMQGYYAYDALLRVAPVMRAAFGKGRVEPGKYPDMPYPLTEKEAAEREERRRRANFERMLAQMNTEAQTNRKQKEANGDG